MKLSHYEVFLKVAEKENISKAAGELYLTQPAVSQILRDIEEETGTKLFTRHPRGVSLTPEGKLYYDVLKEGVQRIQSARNLLDEINQLKAGSLRIGVSDIISRYILPEKLRIFSESFPEIKITIRAGTTKELEEMVIDGDVELVIGFHPHNSQLQFHKMHTIHESFAASEDLVKKLPKVLSIEELKEQRIMMLDQRSESRKLMDGFFMQKGLELKPDIELASHDLLIFLAKEGLGVACIAREFKESLTEVIVDAKLPRRDIGYYVNKRKTRSKAIDAFIKILEEQ